MSDGVRDLKGVPKKVSQGSGGVLAGVKGVQRGTRWCQKNGEGY